MVKERVLLVSNRSVLAAGVLHLLQGSKELEVDSVVTRSPEMEDKVKLFDPQVIIVIVGGGSGEQSTMSRILELNSGARIICVDPNHQEIEVHRVNRVTASSFDVLLQAILE